MANSLLFIDRRNQSIMKNLYKLALVFLFIGLFVSNADSQKVGSTSMQFLHVMPCARGTALGDAYTVLASGADAVFWNPSGLASLQKQELSSTYIKWIFDARQGSIAYATPLGDIGVVGLQIQYVDFGEFEETSLQRPYIKNPDFPGMTGRTFHPFSYLVGLTYAKSLTDKFSTGLTIKYAHESLFDGNTVLAMVRQGYYEEVKTWANAILFDFGVGYNSGFKSVRLGASIQNFGPGLKYAKETSNAPLLFRFGIAGNIIGKEALFFLEDKNRLTVEFDLFQPNDYAQQAHLGCEYEFSESFALRAGYKFNYDYESFTFGGGIKQNIGPVQLSIDYSYGSIGTYLGNVQRISLGARLP